MTRKFIRNELLHRVTNEDFVALEPMLEKVPLAVGQELSLPGAPIETLYFIESGVCSVEVAFPGLPAIEVGLVGHEGVTDHVMDEGDISIFHVWVQVAGSALSIRSKDYANWIFNRTDALRLMVRYQQAMTVQLSLTALAHGTLGIEQRIARLLLMLFDRSEGLDLPFVHDRLAKMMAVRRSGVTNAIHILEGMGTIKATRGRIHLKDRETLVAVSAGSYGIAEREYERLLGPRVD